MTDGRDRRGDRRRDRPRQGRGAAARASGGHDRRADRWKGIDSAIRSQRLRASGPAGSDAVDEARTLFGRLPAPYVDYVTRFGALRGRQSGDGRVLLGLAQDSALDVRRCARVLRALHQLPTTWIPIEFLPDAQVACVDAGTRNGAVALLDLEDLDAGPVALAPTLVDFVYEWLGDLRAIATTVDHLQRRRELVAQGRRPADKLDRPGEWTVSRMCTQDVVFAVLRTRHNRDHNRHDISVFATSTLSSFAPGATVRAALAAVLCEAHLSGGPLAVAFGGDGKGPIPGPLRRWAGERGFALPHRGGWDADTGEALFVEAADLTDGTRALLPLPSVSTAAVCFAVASDTWAPEAVEALLRWSASPQRILSGRVRVTDRLDWIVDRQAIRTALVVAAAARVLRRGDAVSDDDDSGLALRVDYESPSGDDTLDASTGMVELRALDDRPMRLPWRHLAGPPMGDGAVIRMRVLAVENHLLRSAVTRLLVERSEPGDVLVVPADANSSTAPEVHRALDVAADAGITVLAAPEYTTTLDSAGTRAVLRARTART